MDYDVGHIRLDRCLLLCQPTSMPALMDRLDRLWLHSRKLYQHEHDVSGSGVVRRSHRYHHPLAAASIHLELADVNKAQDWYKRHVSSWSSDCRSGKWEARGLQ